ncbi:NAD(P)-dependent dehydrogenase (short-subunit alcohol dehydrogenase family) [Sphingomonas naasensis]|uniref:SDR family oxidoreductase n=1 Tax=Sphingomonas naasensis TaxID=1344951 RepID=A0A4S1WIU5_9SPHN|nr:SDR family oxidoreductase [Sphingomonas naasensis]NIJ22092.1 NAD(P)-dependent dehydrogenase (short-subunit alcohol dehydrogenase family) [Sphingomonas naasensis]TGX42235.1 SDR family oxidoreductase [Sphingomonas naasensis]
MAGEKAIFITGGGSGIGQAVAKLFARKGWRVGLADVNAAGLEATRAMLPAGMVTTHVMDVRDRDQWRDALATFSEASGGRLDVLFNNAGIAIGGPLAGATDDEIDRIVGINLVGVINGARAAYPLLKATPGSTLVNTASAAAIYGSGGLALYAAVKFGVRGLSEALDAEWAGDGIKVRVVMPSFIDTPLLDSNVSGTNRTARDSVRAAGLEFTPVDQVAEEIWNGIERDKLHVIIGKTARRLAFAARWMPGALRKQMRRGGMR